MISKDERERREFVYEGINTLLYDVCDSQDLVQFLEIQGEGEDEMRFLPEEIRAFDDEGYVTIEAVENYKPIVEKIYNELKKASPSILKDGQMERMEAALRVIDYDLQLMRAEAQKDIDFVNSITGKSINELVDIICDMDRD